LDQSVRRFEARYDVTSLEGGRHPSWGTANRIVPLGEAYLELVTVIDRRTASSAGFGRWVAGALGEDGRPFGWAVRTTSIDHVANRLGLIVSDGSRLTPDGHVVEWRSAGIDEAAGEPSLPFFIEWGDPDWMASRRSAGARRLRLVKLKLEGHADRLADWLGDHRLPIVVRGGSPRVAGIVLSDSNREVSIP
jgi:hypothetical protein